MSRRRRLDAELLRRGLVRSRTEAQEAIAGGLVTVDGAPAMKAATQVLPSQALTLLAPPRRYVSRGGDKLAGALETFEVDPSGRRCLDAGVSTGGFTDCLLRHGAASVVGVDVGYGQVHERLRRDERVEVLERTNVRELTADRLDGPPPDLLVADLSFISLTVVLPALSRVAAREADMIVLVKPQFEAQRADVGKGGVVRDPTVWRRVLGDVAATLVSLGWRVRGARPSPLLGPAGNVEFLVHASRGRTDSRPVDVEARLDVAVSIGEALRDGGVDAAHPAREDES